MTRFKREIGGVRLTPAELRHVFTRHDVRQAVSWQLGYCIAFLIGGMSLFINRWAFVLALAFYALTAAKAYRKWQAMEAEEGGS